MSFPNYDLSIAELSLRRAAMYGQFPSRENNDPIRAFYNGIAGSSTNKTTAIGVAEHLGTSPSNIDAKLLDNELNNTTGIGELNINNWKGKERTSNLGYGAPMKYVPHFDWRNYAANLAQFEYSKFWFTITTRRLTSFGGTPVFDSFQIGSSSSPLVWGGSGTSAATTNLVGQGSTAPYSSLYNCQTWGQYSNLHDGKYARPGQYYKFDTNYASNNSWNPADPVHDFVQLCEATGILYSITVHYEVRSLFFSYQPVDDNADDSEHPSHGIIDYWYPTTGNPNLNFPYSPAPARTGGFYLETEPIFADGGSGILGTNYDAFGFTNQWNVDSPSAGYPSSVPSQSPSRRTHIINNVSGSSVPTNPGNITITGSHVYGPSIGGYNIEDFFDPCRGVWGYPTSASTWKNSLMADNACLGIPSHHFGLGIETYLTYFG